MTHRTVGVDSNPSRATWRLEVRWRGCCDRHGSIPEQISLRYTQSLNVVSAMFLTPNASDHHRPTLHSHTRLFNNASSEDMTPRLTTIFLAVAVAALRSTSIGVRCQAVALFPRLFDLFPFPVSRANASALQVQDGWGGVCSHDHYHNHYLCTPSTHDGR
jgi:hypothetical protein